MASPAYRDEFVDGLLDQGRAEGKVREAAKILEHILAARGFLVSDEVRARIRSCVDTDRLEAWIHAAISAETVEAVFGD
ncbi:hypothetical protein [Nocardia altamirensis]|uniref:hypothetical protein n=1 Tax=Nocardia altamirensis TaxID=472158 RepID=UPI0008404D8E|nr:hypothetical protein [Nocardia altamirensis]